MTVIHAHRRAKKQTIPFKDGTVLVFEPNELGHVVCDVKAQELVDILLNIPTGFRLYDEQPEPEPAASPLLGSVPSGESPPEGEGGNVSTDKPDEPHPYVLVGEHGSYDLRPLTDAELHSFATANGVKVSPKAKGDTIRDKIVDHFKKAD